MEEKTYKEVQNDWVYALIVAFALIIGGFYFKIFTDWQKSGYASLFVGGLMLVLYPRMIMTLYRPGFRKFFGIKGPILILIENTRTIGFVLVFIVVIGVAAKLAVYLLGVISSFLHWAFS